jgi:TetR/AcrR family macrolide resistance operon transcriptional repressor
MPRPKLLSDDEVLDATARVVSRRGPALFTLADVAAETGLARSTLIQRFENRAGLFRQLVQRNAQRLPAQLAALPGGEGPQATRAFLRALVSVLRGERIHEYLLTVVEEVTDPGLAEHARSSLRAVREAIAARLPAEMPERAAVARHLQAVMQGASMQWAIEREGELAAFVAARLETALSFLFPGEHFSSDPAPPHRGGLR